MKYYQIPPAKELSGYVQFFWVGELAASAKNSFTHLSIATRFPQFIFHYKGRFAKITASGKLQSSFSSGLQGPSYTHNRFVSYENVGIFGIEFFPYAIPVLFSIPATELTNRFIDLASLLGQAGSQLEEQIFAATSSQQRVAIASAFLQSYINRPVKQQLIESVQLIEQTRGGIHTEILLNKVRISQRHLERLFREYVGLSPRQYARVARFETAVSYLHKTDSFTRLALDLGYYDQAHFNHDFLEFAGMHPRAYLKATADYPIQER